MSKTVGTPSSKIYFKMVKLPDLNKMAHNQQQQTRQKLIKNL